MRPWAVLALVLAVSMSGCAADDASDSDARDPDAQDAGSGGSSTSSTSGTSSDPPTEPSDNETRREPVTWVVTMRDVAFQDSPATIQRGDTVRWVHEDGATTHRVETRDGAPEAFDSGDMTEATQSEFVFTFDTVGDYAYFCRYHEGAMSGTLAVEESYQARPGDASEGPGTSNETGGSGDGNVTGGPRDPVTWEIEISGTAFVDGSLTIQAGDTVRWLHRDGSVPHTVTADDGSFGSGPVYMVEAPAVDTYEFTFDASGTFPYSCEVHPSMQETITVLDVHSVAP